MKQILFFFFILFLGCGFHRDLVNQTESQDLIVKAELKLPLDTLSGDFAPSIQILKTKNQKLLYVNDMSCKCINIYDLATRQQVNKIKFVKEGPNGIVGNRISMFVHTQDSIFIHSTTIPKIFLIDGKGNLIKTFNLLDRSMSSFAGYNSFPIGTTFAPMHMSKNILYMNTYNIDPVKDHTTVFTCMMINIRTGEIEFKFPRPSYYNAGNWGFASFRARHTFIYVPSKELTIISHGNSHNLVLVNDENLVKEIYAGSSFIDNLKPISDDLNEFIDENETRNFEANTGCYSGVIYNPFKKIYYRLATLPIPESRVNEIKRWDLKSIIILGEDFNKTGEHIIPGEYNFSMNFVDENGLHIFNQKKFNESEGDSLIFDVFTEIIKNEN